MQARLVAEPLRHRTRVWAVYATEEAADAAELDPERVVLFDDLRPFLARLTSPVAQPELFLALADLFGVSAAHNHLPSSHPLQALAAAAAETPTELAFFLFFYFFRQFVLLDF
mgnify:CR=1 FL=1